MRHLVADIETDGLLDQLTTVHSLVLRCLESGAVLSCSDHDGYTPIAEGLRVLQSAERTYWHNGINFDIPALRKVYPSFTIDESKVRDTLLMARLRFAHIKESDFKRWRQHKLPGNLIGRHSLEAWGYRLGLHKGDFGKTTDWSTWTPEMQTYCEGDTAVTARLVTMLRSQRISAEAMDTEHQLAWYLAQQERNGVPFDYEAATTLAATLAARRAELESVLAEVFGSWEVECKPFTPKRDNKTRGYKKGVPVVKKKTITFNPKSRQHIANRLTALYGWQPTEFTESGEPVMDDDTLKGLDFPALPELVECLLVSKRLGQLSEGKQAWLKYATKDGAQGGAITGMYHIHGSIISCGTVTSRGAHMNPNLGQVPKVTSPYGGECRELFTVPRGWKLLGADASGLELRCLAHYMAKYDNGAYVDVILNGDVHSVNRDALGLVGKEGRDAAKTFIYAFLYGAGDEKLGSIILPLGSPDQQRAAGAKLRKKFLKGLPAMGYLTDAVKRSAKKNGYLKLIDGRLTFIRSEHAALNSLLQGTGAVICKRWIVEFNRRMTERFGPQGWDNLYCGLLWIHDEIEVAVRPDIAEEASAIAIASIEHMTEHFNFRCPLAGEAKLGTTWKDVH